MILKSLTRLSSIKLDFEFKMYFVAHWYTVEPV